MRKLVLAIMLGWSSFATAAVVNVEFNFTPFIGDPATADQVETVPGSAQVFINNVFFAEQPVQRNRVPVLFEDRQITPAVWVPVVSLGPVVRKGRNTIRIEFQPEDSQAPYRARLSWASVTDQVQQPGDAGSGSATNQADGGNNAQQGSGKLVFERAFVADFVPDLPWHHYPPVQTLSDADKQALAALIKARADAFKPDFSAVYRLLEGHPGIDFAALRRLRCIDKAYAAGVRIASPSPDRLDFLITGNQEVVIKGKAGDLYAPADPKTFQRIKGDNMQMCAGMALSIAYPPHLAVVRNPAGKWEVVY